MIKGKFSPSTMLLIELASRPDGVCAEELPEGMHPRYLWKAAYAGRVFTLKTGSRIFVRRYFETQQRADSYYLANPRPKYERPSRAKPKPLAIAQAPKVIKPVAGGPARLPGDYITTPDTVYTYGKKPPERIYHTNTYGRIA